jgi:DNA repair protein RadC
MELTNSQQAAQFLRSQIKSSDAEEFWAIALNSICNVIHARMLFKGTVDSCPVHPRDIFRFALQTNATSIIIGHNHPSGACFPSHVDITLSKDLKKAGKLLQIPILDHVIITTENHYSFADQGWWGEYN